MKRTSKGLIIRKQWLDKIFHSGKKWEMRSTRTAVRGPIKLIEAGSGNIVGECMIAGCHLVTEDLARWSFEYHQVEDLALLEKWRYAWRLSGVRKYSEPVPYDHPRGAVIWVNL